MSDKEIPPQPSADHGQQDNQTVVRATDTGTCNRCGGLVSREAGIGLFKCHSCDSVQSQAHYPPI